MITSDQNPLANFCDFRDERNERYARNMECPTTHDSRKRVVALLETAAETDVLALMLKYHPNVVAITPMAVYHTAMENMDDAMVLSELKPYHALRVIERILAFTGFRQLVRNSMWVKRCYDQ